MNKSKVSILAALCTALCAQLPAAAVAASADSPFDTPKFSTVSYEAGLRFWYGWGETDKDLYGTTKALFVSRLTYDGLNIYAGEAYARGDHSSGWFLKGYVGAGSIDGGHLNDEDFPPITTPYSSTHSAQENGTLAYASIDLGYKIVKGGDFNIGAFVGYHYLNQKVSAFGCSQTAANPSICAASIPETIKVISQDNDWHSLRLGLDAHVDLSSRLKLSVEGAWLPRVWLNGFDTHWLRIGVPGGFTGPVPEDGRGWGYQFEGLLAYMVNDYFSIGIGGRYWHMQTTAGHTHFENHVVTGTALPQELRWSTDNYGVFLQGSILLGPYSSEVF